MVALRSVSRTMTALLEIGDPSCVDEADRAIWDYLWDFEGNTAQACALKELSDTVQSLRPQSMFHPALSQLLAQHHHRLAEA
jgi:hypothetical protein